MQKKSSSPEASPDTQKNNEQPINLKSPELALYWLSAIIETAEDAIVSKTLDGIITSWNKGAERIFGYTAEEAIGQSVTMLIPEDHPDEEPAILARLRAGKRIEHYETVRQRKDGKLINISLTVSPIVSPEGKIIGASKVARDITESRRAESALREQAEVIRQAYDAIFLRDSTNAITLWNHGAERTYGYTQDEALGRSPHELLKTVPPIPLGDIYASLRHDGYWEGELLHTRKDNVQIIVESRWATVRDDTGNVTSILEITRDVSERKRAEERLMQAAAIVENSDDAIISKDLDGIILSWNPGAELLYGYTAEEVIGQPVTILIPDDRPDEEPHILEQIRRGERVHHYETQRRRKNGTIIDVSLTVSPVRNADGRIVGASKIARDITARKRADEQLREQTEIIETVNTLWQTLAGELDMHNLVQAVTDAATEISNARFGSFFYNVLNESGESYMLYTLSGVPREAFAHFPMPRNTDIFAPTFNGEGTVLIADVKKDPRYGKNSPYYGMPEGHLPVTSYLAVPVVSRSGEVYGGLFFGHPDEGVFTERVARIIEGLAAQASVAMDNARLFEAVKRASAEAEQAATENARLYREAQESNRLKDEFLATVSHELRTPLTAILGWAHMLRTGQFSSDSALKAFETIERNARAQAQLIDDLLDVSRIITGKLRIDVRQVDPNSFVEAAIEAVRPAAEAKGIRIQKIMDTGVVTVSGDPVRLQQVVWNLLANAIKFTQRGGKVQVRLERVNSHVEIAVSDTGAGISSEFLPHVFDRFRQANQRTTRQHGGMGLGLSIVRHLVEIHGGTVVAESPGEGKGSTFTVLLPVAPVYQVAAEGERVHPAARDTLPSFECLDRLDGMHVLVVDDEPDTRELLRAGLGQCGAEVTVASSSTEAIEAMQAVTPDLLISDIGMPEVDGYELIRRIRSMPDENGGRIPAIALTAYARVEDRMQALRAGYQMHVPKPVEMAELVAVAASLVQRER
ncbi:MAG TPA: PAS domain S-box protein [Pyrinomonadaceae bacterium]